ncbi:MAG: hypothetical protein ACTHN0_15735, partial [Aquihabitans sp.]
MSLADRLAAVPDDAPGEATSRRRPSPAVDDQWSATKRAVRAMVLEEVAPIASDLGPDDLNAAVRSALDLILQRE